MSERGLKILADRKLLPNLKFGKLDFCKHCLFGKQSKQKFKTGKHTSKGILDYIHSDVWGPASTTSYGGSSYFVSFIDEFSRKVWVYMLKRKSDVFSVFKQFRALEENNTGRTIKCLITDNGGEFTSKEFDNYCKDAGIKRHKTTIYTPQQNGVAERMNKTLLERARSMLSNAELQKELWMEAVATTCYMINRSPSTAIGCKIPQEGSGIDYERVPNNDHQEVPTDGSQPIEEVLETSLRRSTRIKRPPRRYDDYVTSVAFTTNDDEPLCYQEAIEGSKSDKWKAAMKDEMKALGKNGTWDRVELLKDRKTVGCK
eukprot:PITA_07226